MKDEMLKCMHFESHNIIKKYSIYPGRLTEGLFIFSILMKYFIPFQPPRVFATNGLLIIYRGLVPKRNYFLSYISSCPTSSLYCNLLTQPSYFTKFLSPIQFLFGTNPSVNNEQLFKLQSTFTSAFYDLK